MLTRSPRRSAAVLLCFMASVLLAGAQTKRIKPPAGVERQKETVRVMNRLMRAGYSSPAIFKLLRGWKVEAPVEETAEDDGYGLPEF